MAAETIIPLRDWVEPAHPTLVQLHDDLITIYTHIRDAYQPGVDKAFDEVSRQIGYVVTTTVPIVLGIKDRTSPFELQMGSETLKGTLFEKALKVAINPQPLPPRSEKFHVSANSYNMYLVWYSALKLRLRTDWMEPAHVSISADQALAQQLRPGVREPAHWFDAGSFLPQEELVLIDAIDKVYPDLKLADRITASRSLTRPIGPGVREPAHFRAEIREPAHYLPGVREPAHFRPGVREPAHFHSTDKAAQVLLSQIAEVLRQAGF
jgi:hypothetical protein